MNVQRFIEDLAAEIDKTPSDIATVTIRANPKVVEAVVYLRNEQGQKFIHDDGYVAQQIVQRTYTWVNA